MRKSYFTIPPALLQQPISRQITPAAQPHRTVQPLQPTMPKDFLSSVERLVIALLADGYPDVHLTAEAASMSRRTLQRRLAAAGLTYSQLVNETRTRLAAEWLRSTAMPISEMAASLGYTDASNFTRAFRRRTGISPRAFRPSGCRGVACRPRS
jgi:AraC-like DNA-binding protein